jgi:hypothetical protein
VREWNNFVCIFFLSIPPPALINVIQKGLLFTEAEISIADESIKERDREK